MARAERPLDPDGSAVTEFAADLRKLREKAGSPPYRELARRVHYSFTTLSDAAGGRRLPSLEVALAYVTACGGSLEEWRARWHVVAAELSAYQGELDPTDAAGAPYVGLLAYGPRDAERFFGRKRVVNDLAAQVGRKRFLAVFGPSGVGKSSVLRAGLIPRLTSRAARPVLLLTPGAEPLTELSLRLSAVLKTNAATVKAGLESDAGALAAFTGQLPRGDEEDAPLVVVVDQFEEVFTLCQDAAERSRFIELLVTAANTDDDRCRVVVVTRSDFYAQCTAHPGFVQAMGNEHFVIGAMSTDELREAIVRPSGVMNCTVETALVTRLVSEATGQPGVLPMLSHVLRETWRRRRGNNLTISGYEAAGGIERAVATTAEQVYNGLDEAQQWLVRNLLIRLTALGEGTDDTRRRVHRTELDDSTDLAVVLEQLTRARLLTVDRDTIEISHEALFRVWPRLRAWLSEDREGLRVHRQLAEATATWNSLGQDPGALYRGGRLTSAAEWAAKNGHVLTNAEQEFLRTSLDAEAQTRATARRTTRRLRQLVALLGVLLVVAVATSVLAVRAQQIGHDQRDNSLAQKALLEADKIQLVDPRLAAQLRLAAHQLVPTSMTRDSLLSHPTLATIRLTGHDDAITEASFSPNGNIVATSSKDHTVRLWNVNAPPASRPLSVLHGHTDAVHSVAFSQDGLVVATASRDKTIRLWSIADAANPRHMKTLTGHTDFVLSVSFGHDGHTIISTSKDHTARLWDATSGRALSVLDGHSDLVRKARFAPDGRTVATAGWDGTTRLWDISDHAQPRHITALPSRSGRAQAVAFHPGGTLLATGGEDGITRIWDLSDKSAPKEIAALSGGERSSVEGIETVAFSPDGSTLAAAGWGRSTRLWDLTDARSFRELGVLAGHTSVIRSVAFSPDGRILASAGDDGTTRLEDLRQLRAFSGHANAVIAAAFSPDGAVLATGGVDKKVNLWTADQDGHLRQLASIDGHPDAVLAVAFDRTGQILVTAGSQGNVLLWNVSRPGKPVRLAGITAHTAGVNSLAISPDNRTLITASTDKTAALWDLSEPGRPHEIARLIGHDLPVQVVTISPDGRTAASAGADNTIRLWNITNPRNPQPRTTLAKHTGGVGAVAFSPTGAIMATGGSDEIIRFWNTANPDEVHEITTISVGGPIETLAFSPDGTQFATPGPDQSIRLWDVSDLHNPRDIGTMSGHSDTVYAIVFNPVSRMLVTADAKHTIRPWESDPDLVRERLCAIAGPTITPNEWATYFPDVDYQPPCSNAGNAAAPTRSGR